MARAYTIATAALALEIPLKWLDNLLSHHKIAGVRQERQGIARRLTIEGLLVLGVIIRLNKELGIPLARTVEIAERIATASGQYTSPDGVHIRLNLNDFQTRLLERLESAVEVAPAPRRGRPFKNKTGRLD
ncbi:MAG: hypothetical protein ABI469_00495 [Gemmatimonadales bacterium]